MKDPILVYTVGKVGSTSVSKSLKASGVDRTVYHIHWLAPEQLARVDAFYRARDRRYRGTVRAQRFRPEFVWLGEHLSRQIYRDPERCWQVITLVRDPVARDVSSFFQNLDSFFDYWIDDQLLVSEVEGVARGLVTLFLEAYVRGAVPIGMDGDPLGWFDRELKLVFGVDVYAAPFPKLRGFGIYDAPKAHVLVLRLEDLERSSEEAIREYMGLERFHLVRSNIGESKTYATVYRRFLELIRLPDEYLERIYASKYSTHFYSEDELARFRSRWRGDHP